jgi:putative spermidine/putrescine transport system substrate-binding protein
MRLRLLCAAGALVVSLGPSGRQAQAADAQAADPHAADPHAAGALTVAAAPGAWLDALRQVVLDPFAKATGIAVRGVPFDGGIGLLRLRTEAGGGASGVPWDVVQVPGDTLLLGCGEGLLAPLDFARLGGTARLPGKALSRCGVGLAQVSLVLAWDRDKFQGTPSWADFWDVAKYPGKRGLRRGVRGNLEIALMADGVAPGDVYKVLATPDGVDRAFHKLDQLKPYLVWWRAPGEATRILGSGEVLLTSAFDGQVAVTNRAGGRNFGIQRTGSLAEVLSLAIVAGRPQQDDAYRLISYAIDPARERALSAVVPYPGLTKTSPGAPAVPSPPGGLMIDNGFWHDNLDRLSQRFEAWLAH